ncbi:hypothetical protein PHYPSEUDO_000330 [Phytophthora pseudosyringae]|uniref:Uncharacterized protein n=1 Tax=Phytophthora pseudosyringae TaxID=221518 RepID=A0A8T1VYZ4_9STRA|nr:hypothetical protein PHYPSEUDO_000330 [Phytophthora pseudosyringae]
MDGSFIPPPFPFPEAWPRVCAEQQQRQERRWLTPMTIAAVSWPAPAPAECFYPPPPSATTIAAAAGEEDTDEEDDGGEYEYGYVLSDEWRERFQASVQLQQQFQQQQQKRSAKSKKKTPQQRKKFKQQRQAVNAEAVAAASASRSGHLQREVQAAKSRELARKWKRRGGADAPPEATAALESSLNARFDEFCDAFQPVVWPHESLQR